MSSSLISDYGPRVYPGWRSGQTLPWLDYSSESLPRNHRTVLDFCHFLWGQNSDVREGFRRVIAYFRTGVEIETPDPTNKSLSIAVREKWRSYLMDGLRVQDQNEQSDLDVCCYGNSFMTPVVPFRRMLACPQCGSQYALEAIFREKGAFRYRWDRTRLLFMADCPKCRGERPYVGPFRIIDLPTNSEEGISAKFIPPQEMEQVYCEWTHKSRWRWRLPARYIQKIRDGSEHHLRNVPTSFLSCIRDNVPLQFHEHMILHTAEQLPSGMPNRGWGLSRMLLGFRDLWNLQVMRRSHEALLLDYLVPTRLIFPAPRGGTSDAGGSLMDGMLSVNQGDMTSLVQQIFRDRMDNPLAAYYLPFPIETRLMGGEASQLVPVQLLEAAQQQALNAVGIPLDFYRGTLQTAGVLPGLKLMEAQWQHLPQSHNRLLMFWVRLLADLMRWEPVVARCTQVPHAVGIQEQMLLAQLGMSNLVSGTDLLQSLGKRWYDQQRIIQDEARAQARLQSEMQAEMEDEEMGRQFMNQPGFPAQTAGTGAMPGGAPPAGGDPAMMGQSLVSSSPLLANPDMPVSPMDIMAEAQALAQQLGAKLPSQRSSELRMIADRNPLLHSQVLKELDKARYQLQRQGGTALAQQTGSTLL